MMVILERGWNTRTNIDLLSNVIFLGLCTWIYICYYLC